MKYKASYSNLIALNDKSEGHRNQKIRQCLARRDNRTISNSNFPRITFNKNKG